MRATSAKCNTSAARRLNLGLFQKDINVAWDLAPHDISILLHLLDERPISVSCQGSSHVTRGIEDVTMMYLTFAQEPLRLHPQQLAGPEEGAADDRGRLAAHDCV